MTISDCAFVRLANGLRLAYVEQGERDGAAIVFLHGYSDSHRSFDLLMPHVPRAWRSIAVTQRGHGHSDKPHEPYAVKDFAADVPLLLDALNIDRAILVGHSMGSSIALQAAADYPDRVAGVALLGAFAAFQGNAAVDELGQAIQSFTESVDPEFVLAFQEATVAGMIPQRYLDTVVNESLRCPSRVWRRVFQGMQACDPLAAAERCRTPGVVIWGDADAFCPRADQLVLRDTLPEGRLFTLRGVGHALHWERPAETASILRAFVAELDDADPFRDAVFG